MPRAPSVRPLLLAVVVLFGAALLPARWLRPLNDVSAVLAVPLAPLNDVSNRLRRWLRPGDDPALGEPEAIAALTADRDTYRSLWHAERLRNEELVERLEDARLAEEFHRGSVFDPVRADVVGRAADAVRGPVRLNAGSSAGVAPGDVAVFRGAHLIGRVMDDVSRLTCVLLPLSDRATGRLQAAVSREAEPADPAPPMVRLLLAPEGDGAFSADVAADAGVRLGDRVVLDDPDWPDTARGMIVGEVEAIEPRDEQPLRVRLRVRPVFDVHGLRSVVLKVTPRPGSAPDRPEGVP